MSKSLKYLLPVLAILALWTLRAQEGERGVALIKRALEAEDFRKADRLWQSDVRNFFAKKNLDTLLDYIELRGAIVAGLEKPEHAAPAVYSFIENLEKLHPTPTQIMEQYRYAADFFEQQGDIREAYVASEKALEIAEKHPGENAVEWARSEYNLGVYANQLGDVNASMNHHRKALQLRETKDSENAENLYFSYNAMGGVMWYASKYDSAKLFFTNALRALEKMPSNELNNWYRPGNIYNNLAAIHSSEGRTTEAIEAMHTTIDCYQKFIASPKQHVKKRSANEGVCQAFDNLAGIYKEIGDYQKAGDLLRYSYQRKKAIFGVQHPGVMISEILLGQHFNSVQRYDSAYAYLTAGLGRLSGSEGDFLFWAADGWYNLAMVYANTNRGKEAAECYEKSEALYEQSYQGVYDNVYMDFLRNASVFYANRNDFKKAFEKANRVYRYLESIGEASSLQGFYQLLNIAELHYLSKNYSQAIRFSQTALQTVNTKMKDGHTTLDSVKIEAFKPKAMLIEAKSLYALRAKRDSIFLVSLSEKLDTALQILENRKLLIDDAENITILMADHQALIDFAAKLALELYEQSWGSLFLEKFINLRESGLYHRLRSRLDMAQSIAFSRVPPTVLAKEKQLKDAIKTALVQRPGHDSSLYQYLRAQDTWNSFLQQLRTQHPDYYRLRYATVFQPLPQLQQSVPEGTTLLRYYLQDSNIVVVVGTREQTKLVVCRYQGLEEMIDSVQKNQSGEKEQLNLLYALYQKLWQPVEQFVNTERVIVIPDGSLHHLSFEMLPFERIQTYKQLSSKSLLAKHSFSYHYTLFLLDEVPEKRNYQDNYVAFAPGFSDELKSDYLSSVKDSLYLDESYLSLLPQPNANRLAKKISELVGGEVFLESASTRSSFRENAGNHKVLHIATHAAFNDISPEKSGLVFAKSGKEDSNRLLLNDIYNCNLSSELTLLTACESGRSGYHDGEGMVSLAHAFNYAGSKNIVTALWKIDEQSSSQITEYFINYLKKGKPTDVALRSAKLDYLRQAEGRLAHPGYWSGMILMGMPSSVDFGERTAYSLGWIAVGAILLFSTALLIWRRRGSPNAEA